MPITELTLGLIVLALAWLLVRRRLAGQANRIGEAAPPDGDEPPLPATTTRHDTALGELREFREALKPAEHSRVERRRPGGSGPYGGPDRRKSNRARATDPQQPLDRPQ